MAAPLLAVAYAVMGIYVAGPISCDLAPGTLIAQIVPVSGNKPIFLTGDLTDFRLVGNDVVVGPKGISRAHCNTTQIIKATQN